MSNINTVRMKEREETELEKFANAHITEVSERPFHIADDDPFLVRKLEEAYKTFEEAPIPEWLLKRMEGKD
jgi:hypothetical protein